MVYALRNDQRSLHQETVACKALSHALGYRYARFPPRPHIGAGDQHQTVLAYLGSSNHKPEVPKPLRLREMSVWQGTSSLLSAEERGADQTKDIDAESMICFLHTIGKVLFTLGTSSSRVQKAGPESRLFVFVIRLLRALQAGVESTRWRSVQFPFLLGISTTS